MLPGRQELRFVALLTDSGLPAIKIATRYLLRGSGRYRPVPPIDGVDFILVEEVRAFGEVAIDRRQVRLQFEREWSFNHSRRAITDQFGDGEHNELQKEWFLARYMSAADVRISNQKVSSDYRVSFAGAAGTWSAVFVVGCMSLTSVLCVDHEDSFDDDDV